jgi:hypothetical protein
MQAFEPVFVCTINLVVSICSDFTQFWSIAVEGRRLRFHDSEQLLAFVDADTAGLPTCVSAE